MSTIPEIGPAPFAPGDRVIYRPRPRGVETVELVEYRGEGWGGWYIRTRQAIAAPEVQVRRYDRAELFDPAAGAGDRAALPGGCRRQLRRLGRAAGGVALVVLVLSVLWGVLVELPS